MDHSQHQPKPSHEPGPSCHIHKKPKFDWLLWGSLGIVLVGYVLYWQFEGMITENSYLLTFTQSNFELLNKMALGIALGIFFVGLLDKVPRSLVISALGHDGFSGIVRAVFAGVLLDLCSHGILMVGMKLYERGVRLGQVMAFLIASPWNSFSLTLILWALVGFKWMMTFLLLSMSIALISGMIFDHLVKIKILPENPHKIEIDPDFHFWKEAGKHWKIAKFNVSFFSTILTGGFRGSKMVLKWVFFGVILASLIRTFLSADNFETFFGPTIAGLGLTILVATIIEVCSEGSTPIAADLVTRGGAPGNGFAFLMTGVSTDYTEIMSIKETTNSWKIAWFLPLVTLPQVILIAYILNQL
ncbi:MAG TPA: permease [Candidatus Gracilibacteria bacterium]